MIGDLPNYLQNIQNILTNQYGREPLYPNLLFSDINKNATNLINGAITDITGRAGVGGPTMTFTPW